MRPHKDTPRIGRCGPHVETEMMPPDQVLMLTESPNRPRLERRSAPEGSKAVAGRVNKCCKLEWLQASTLTIATVKISSRYDMTRRPYRSKF